MGLRPGHCYRSLKDRPYTRVAVTVHGKNYVGATPGLRIKQFNMGNPQKDYTHILDLCSEESLQIRDNAMESARITINRYLVKKMGKENYFMRIRVYPFQILRENKQAQGAGADRVSQGMSQAFGKPIGRAVRINSGQPIISVLVEETNVKTAKKALLRSSAKLPCKVSVKVHTDLESIGTRPRMAKIKEAEEKAKEREEAEKEEKAEEKEAEEKEEVEKEEKEEEGKEETEEKKEEEKKTEEKSKGKEEKK